MPLRHGVQVTAGGDGSRVAVRTFGRPAPDDVPDGIDAYRQTCVLKSGNEVFPGPSVRFGSGEEGSAVAWPLHGPEPCVALDVVSKASRSNSHATRVPRRFT